jgi:hypothetical protein
MLGIILMCWAYAGHHVGALGFVLGIMFVRWG